VNVYKAEGQSAADASDALFVAMKAGVTTIPELASALGAVLPYSQSLGVSFDETAAAVSALTKGGLTTAVATTGLRAALNSILAPTEQAKDLAKDLSLEFNAAGLEAMGLAGFLQTVNAATGGSNVLLQQLFGSTEATAVALGFAGSAGESFTEILAQMNVKLGATEEAMSAVDAAASDRMDDALQAMGNTLTRMGSTVLPVLATALEGAASLMGLVADNSDALAIALGILAVRQISAVIGGLVSMSAWLATSEGLFIAGAIAAKGMALAMNLIPFVAVVAGATTIFRAYKSQKEAAELAAQVQRDLNHQLKTYAETSAPSAAKAALGLVKTQAEAARAQLINYEIMIETLRMQGMSDAQGANMLAVVEKQRTSLSNLQMTIAGLSAGMRDGGAAAEEGAGGVNDLADATAKYTASTFAAIPSIGELTSQYGFMAETVRDLMQAQNDLAAADASAGFTKMLAGISGVTEKLGLGVDQAGDFQQALANISAMDTFNGQARAMASLAAHLLDASGGLENMNAEARAAYQSLLDAARSAADVAANASTASSNIGGAAGEAARLAQNLSAAASALAGVINATANLNVGAIGLEAQNRALESGNTLIQARTAGLVAAKKAELASALGSSEGVIRAAATVELNNYTAAVERSSSAQEVNEQLTKAMTASLGGGGGSGGGGLSKATKDAAKEIDKMADEIERLEFDADPLKKYTSEVANLDKLLAGNGVTKLSDGAYQKAVKDLNEEFANSNPTISAFGDAIGDFVAGGMRNFGDLLDSFKNMIKQMIATAIANPIKLALTTAFAGGGTAAAAAGQVAAPAGGIGSLGGILGGVSTFASSVVSGGMGLITSLTGAGGGLASAGTYLSSVLGSATTGIGAFGAAVGAIAVPLLAVGAIFSFFKKSVKELDAGMRVTVDGMDALIETFSKTETKRFWGLSKKVRTNYTEADAEVADPLNAIIAQMQGNVLALSGALGVGSSAFANFAHEITLSTKDMSEEEAQQAVAEALNGIGNAFAALTPDLEQFARDGEEAGDTLTRLVSDLGAVNVIMDTLGHTLQDVSVIGAGTASNFAALFGGIEAMNTATTAFYMGFYTEAERFATSTRQIEAQFDALNIAMPATRAQFRAMVDALDTTTEGGRATYAALVSMSGALDAVLPAVASFTAQIETMVGSLTTELDAMIGTTSEAMRANEQAAGLWYRTASTLRAFIADMRGTAGALVSAGQARAFSEARFQSLLASAVGGDNQAATDLTAAARTLLDNTKATATSALEVARAEARVLSDLQLASGVSDVEGARHDVIAGLLGQQVDLLGVVRDAINSGDPLSPDDIDGLNGQLGALEGAIKAAEMINYEFLKERLSVSVDLIADADIPAALRTMLNNAATGIRANIDYIVRADGLTPDLRWLALTGASEHIKTVDFLTGNTLPMSLSKLALDNVGSLLKTVNFVVGSELNSDAKRIALATSSNLARNVTTAIQRSTPEAVKLALMNVERDASIVRRVVVSSSYTGSLSKRQIDLLEAIGGTTNGKIVLGGSFQFDPSTGFQTWYSSTTRATITTPMSALQSSLNALTAQIRKDAADRAADAARQARIAAITGQVNGSTWAQSAQARASSLVSSIEDLERRTGVSLRSANGGDATLGINGAGGIDYKAAFVEYGSGADLTAFNKAFRGANGLEAQIGRANSAVERSANWLAGLRRQVVNLGSIPAFAMGGTHRGGLARVGENDMELVAPSRIYNPAETRKMMSGGNNDRLESLVVKLTEEVARMRDENTQLAKNRGADLRRVRLLEERREAETPA
jgi:hypothetical protein